MGAPNTFIPCLWLNDEAEEAASFYTRLFPGGLLVATSHYPDGENPSGMPAGSVLTAEIELVEQRFTLLNGGPRFKKNPSISFFVFTQDAAETDRIFGALAEGGELLMPLDAYPWSARYGWVKDRFDVSWQVMLSSQASAPALVPCLMFAGPQHGRAEEAMRFYAGVFEAGRIESIARYSAGEGPEGTVKHGRVVLAGQPMVAMDSHVSHDVTFNEGISLQVMCKSQREIDAYWDRLCEGGTPSVCGWLADRFGVSWQIVPDKMATWLSSKDAAARNRAFSAMMKMKKPDIAALEEAFCGQR